MNKIFSLIILCSFCFIANISSVNATSPRITQAEQRVNEARLLEQYIIRYIIRLRDAEHRFPNLDKNYIETTLQNIESILIELDNIQKGYYSLRQSESILQNTLQYMKILNNELQSKINTIQADTQRELDKEIRRYARSIENIYNLTQRIIELHSRHYLQVTNLSDQDRRAIQVIIRLRQKNEELIRYHERRYHDILDLQTYLRGAINSLRHDISLLRELRRN